MRIVTWNVNSLKARQGRVRHWLEVWEPDIVCLQETKLSDEAFEALAADPLALDDLGYAATHHGQGRWNGVAILSRVGLDDVHVGFEDDQAPDDEARLLWATCGGVRVASVYVPNGRGLDDDHYTYKLAFLDRLRAQLDDREDPGAEVILCGDFNIAPEDRDVWDPDVFVGATHVSQPERDRLRALVDWGLVDTHRAAHDADGLFTYWDYRGGAFHKRQGMRIDFLLASAPLAERAADVRIDREERKPKGNPAGGAPSDHAPLVGDFG
jgi:exodeoxyribonuclease III